MGESLAPPFPSLWRLLAVHFKCSYCTWSLCSLIHGSIFLVCCNVGGCQIWLWRSRLLFSWALSSFQLLCPTWAPLALAALLQARFFNKREGVVSYSLCGIGGLETAVPLKALHQNITTASHWLGNISRAATFLPWAFIGTMQ